MLKRFPELLDQGGAGEDLSGICLRHILERDREVHAWVAFARPEASGDGPLRGIPFGVKDIFETADFDTEYGSPLYRGRESASDAELVAALRKLGAVVLGKTHTTAFAYFDPGPTRNPRDLNRTPGGSSSGSAAAVASGMVPFALGTQTQGSILRPASFCGVAGFKPSYGLLPTAGILPFAPSLDTAGFFTQTAGDMQTLWTRACFGANSMPARRVGVVTPLPSIDAAMPRAVAAVAERIGAARVELPSGFWNLTASVRVINDYEGARSHEARWREHGLRIGEKLAAMVQEGLRIPEDRYREARDFVDEMRRRMLPLYS
ncbi:MAG: amidase, partial [Acidobacteriota bacterium]|nr:amidase [Acidobacteriota bacterium]